MGHFPWCEALAGNKNPKKYAGQRVVIGSVTDGYNPQEEQFGNTRKLLEQLIGSDADILICTKSILWYEILITEEAWTCNRFMVDQHTRWKFQERYGLCFEHWAPYRCYEAGIWGRYPYSLFRIPVFPGITDFEAIFERVRISAICSGSKISIFEAVSKDNYGLYRRKISWSVPLYDEIYNKHNRSYFEALEVKAEKMAKKYDCAFVDNEMPYGRVPQGHPVIVDYFYHEEIRGTENTGKRNR